MYFVEARIVRYYLLPFFHITVKQNPRIRGLGEHYTVLYSKSAIVLYISENALKKVICWLSICRLSICTVDCDYQFDGYQFVGYQFVGCQFVGYQ